MISIGQMYKPKTQNNEIIHPESTQKRSHTSFKTIPITMPQTLLLLPPLWLLRSSIMASPQLGPSSISPWVKSVVAPSGLTRHKTGDGSCNREIRVVLGLCSFDAFNASLQTSLLYYY